MRRHTRWDGAARRIGLATAVAVLTATMGVVGGPAPAGAAATDVSPFGTIDKFLQQQHRDFLGREPSASELAAMRSGMESGATTVGEAIDLIAHKTGGASTWGDVTRLYTAYFLRNPDHSGLSYWLGVYRGGRALSSISASFAGSAEFKSRYGSLSNSAFVQLVYQNVLGRPPDSAGLGYWIGKLNRGTSRGQVMANFSQSNEYRNKKAVTCDLVLAHDAMVKRVPTGDELVAATLVLQADGFAGLVESIAATNEWRFRFPKPGSPTGVTAVGQDKAARVTWTKPTTWGIALTGYAVTPFVGTTPQATRFFGPGSESVVVDNLTNGVAYTFSVVASNAYASSAPGVSPAVTVNPEPQWNTYGGTPGHTGYQAYGSLPATPVLKWERDLGDAISQIAYGDGYVYVLLPGSSAGGSGGLRVYALRPTDGTIAWGPVPVSGTYRGGMLAFANGRVFIMNGDGLLKAVSPQTGANLWSVKLGEIGDFHGNEGLVPYGDALYVIGYVDGGSLLSISQSTGATRWTAEVENGDGSPAVDSSGIYVNQACEWTYKINFNGSQAWKKTTGCSGGGGYTPAVDSGRLWAIDPKVIRNASTGAVIDGYAATELPAVAGSKVVYNNDGTIQGADVADGLIDWSQAGDGELEGSPVVVNGNRTWVVSREGMAYAFNVTGGAQAWSRNVLDDMASPPEWWDIADERVVAVGGGLLLMGMGDSVVAYG